VAVFVVIAAAAIADVTAGPGVQWLSVMLAIFIASLVSSIAGFAFSAICGAMLFHLIEAPVEVVAIMLFCSIANQLMMTWMVRDNIRTDALIPFLVGGAIGLPFG